MLFQGQENTGISIHAPARGATLKEYWERKRTLFQSTLPRGERRITPMLLKTSSVNFNPRSREGSDGICSSVYNLLCISIHAPARGATIPPSNSSFISAISIHAPARGATSIICISTTASKHFNPRSREGSDCNFC